VVWRASASRSRATRSQEYIRDEAIVTSVSRCTRGHDKAQDKHIRRSDCR
jgi:hypothetical protein